MTLPKMLLPHRQLIGSVVIVFLLFLGEPLSAQTAAEVDEILETREISIAQAVRFVLAAAEVSLPEGSTRGWLPKGVSPANEGSLDRPIKLGELSQLIMKSFNIKGSFLYALFPGPRYSYRELRYERLLPDPSDPSMRVSGEQFLLLLEQVLHYQEPADSGTADTEPGVAPLTEAELATGQALNRRVEITLLDRE
jgi:hypothetical protein